MELLVLVMALAAANGANDVPKVRGDLAGAGSLRCPDLPPIGRDREVRTSR